MSTTTRITMEQYDEMIQRGDFEPREEHHVELIYGEISPMCPINPPHDDAVEELNIWSFRSPAAEGRASSGPGRFGVPVLDSVPQPDLAWLRWKRYTKQRPTPEDVLLGDRGCRQQPRQGSRIEGPTLRRGGYRGLLDLNLPGRSVEVREDPQGSTYRSLVVPHPGDEVRPLAFPEVALAVSRLFPGFRHSDADRQPAPLTDRVGRCPRAGG